MPERETCSRRPHVLNEMRGFVFALKLDNRRKIIREETAMRDKSIYMTNFNIYDVDLENGVE